MGVPKPGFHRASIFQVTPDEFRFDTPFLIILIPWKMKK